MCMNTTRKALTPFMTKRGYIGIGQASMKTTDTLCILFGARVPHVLQKRGEGKQGYILIGEAYVHGIMDGEFMSGNNETVDFELF
jgi:hypothetical protein